MAMNDILAISLKGMQNDLAQLERTSMNMVNTSTPGYKREVTSVTPFSQLMSMTDIQSSASEVKSSIDLRPGSMRSTGRALDLAIQGEGFFEINTTEGRVYTRRGNFQIDAGGKLVTDQGYAVMGDKGEIKVKSSSVSIDKNGFVFESGSEDQLNSMPVAQIKLVKFTSPAAMIRIEGSNFKAVEEGNLITENYVQVQQGYLENSNASSAQEMIQLMKTVRHFESMQKMAQGYDELLGMTIRKLGDV
jgi:flagellar basal-body rod protein FlgG